MTAPAGAVSPNPPGRLRLLGFPDDLAGRDWAGPRLDATVQTYRDARALPLRLARPRGKRVVGCMYDRAGSVIRDSERAKSNRMWTANPARLRPTAFPDGPERLSGRTLFAGHRRPVFGHVLLEILPRLWPELDYASFDHVLVYPTRVGARLGPLAAYEHDLLTALGIDPARIVVADRALVVDELVVTTATFALKRAVDPRFVVPFDRAATRLLAANRSTGDTGQAPSRIYLSRSRLGEHLRRARNEDGIEALLEPLGFTILHPQEMSITAQVAAVRAADVIAGCDGSALHLAAFARPGTRLVAIDSRVVENQFMIDTVRGLDALHVLAPVGGATQRDEPWVADLDLVQQAIDLAGLRG